MNNNIKAPKGAETAYFRRFQENFPGKPLIPGQGVYFRPGKTNQKVAKAHGRLRYGVFLGYRLRPGCKWRGEYRIIELSDFLHADLSENAPASKFKRMREHVTAVVREPSWGLHFPLRERYLKNEIGRAHV